MSTAQVTDLRTAQMNGKQRKKKSNLGTSLLIEGLQIRALITMVTGRFLPCLR